MQINQLFASGEDVFPEQCKWRTASSRKLAVLVEPASLNRGQRINVHMVKALVGLNCKHQSKLYRILEIVAVVAAETSSSPWWLSLSSVVVVVAVVIVAVKVERRSYGMYRESVVCANCRCCWIGPRKLFVYVDDCCSVR